MGDGESTGTQFVQYIKERDEARAAEQRTKQELSATESQLYDALQKIDALEKKVNETDKGGKSVKKADPKKKPKGAAVSSTQNGTVKTAPKVTPAVQTDSKGCPDHPPVASTKPAANCWEYYKKLADQFPALPMLQVLEAEKKFIAADIDKSGCIDRDELDTVLTKTSDIMFTKAQIDEIFKEVDTDGNNTVDFVECLFILNKLVARRPTKLPTSVQQNYSKTCAIQ